MTRFIFITGGVVSSLGKGLMAAALAALLQARGYSVRIRLHENPLGITLAFARDDMAAWIDARRQNVRHVRADKLRSGSKQVAISACEVLRGLVRDKDYAIRKTSDPTGGRNVTVR